MDISYYSPPYYRMVGVKNKKGTYSVKTTLRSLLRAVQNALREFVPPPSMKEILAYVCDICVNDSYVVIRQSNCVHKYNT